MDVHHPVSISQVLLIILKSTGFQYLVQVPLVSRRFRVASQSVESALEIAGKSTEFSPKLSGRSTSERVEIFCKTSL